MRDGQNAAERSAAESANAAFAQAREALDLIYEFVPPRLQEQQGVDQLLTQLMGQERQFNQPSELRKAVSLIDSAGAEGGIEAAYIERNVFLRQQPDLVANGRLAASMRAIARAEATRVTFETTNDEAITKTKADDEVECQVLFTTNRDSSDEVARSERLAMVIAPTSSAVFAMDALSLDLLWRYPVGATDASPVACRDEIGRGVILGDQRSQSVVRLDATTGELVWSCSVPQFVGQPKVVGEQAIIATADGQLVEIDLAVGRVTQRIRFDQGIRCGPAVVGAGERLVQVGDHSVIYLVSREERRCLHAHYLGHELGSVSLPPLISGGHVFLIEKVGRDRSELHVVRMGDQFQIVASFAIDGRVATMPVFLRGALYVATTDGQLHTIRHNPEDKRRPFRLGPSSAISDGVEGHRHPTFLAVKAGRIWAGGDGVTIFDPAANDSDPLRRKRLDNSLRVSQPLDVSSSSDGLVIGGFTPESEFQVRRWDARNQTVKAEATLAFPTAAQPLVGGGRRELWNLTEGGSLYKVAWDEIAQGSSSNLVVAPALTLVDKGGRVEAFRESVKSDDFGVFATRADHNELVFVPLAVGNSLQRVKVAGPLVGPAVPFGARWMVAFQHGAIGLLDNPSGEFAAESFLPGTGLSDSLQWSQPIVTADHRAVVYDGDLRLFSIRHTSGLEKLDLELETVLESSLRVAPVQVGAVLWSVNQQNQLLAFNAASLELSAAVDLPADVQWGPVAIGGQALLTTDDGTLICVGDGKQPLWQAKYEHGPVTGACELSSGEIALATGAGVLWRVRADTGEQVGATVELKQPLAFGPFIFGDHLSVMSTDGTLLVLRQTTQGESDGSGNKEVSGP